MYSLLGILTALRHKLMGKENKNKKILPKMTKSEFLDHFQKNVVNGDRWILNISYAGWCFIWSQQENKE